MNESENVEKLLRLIEPEVSKLWEISSDLTLLENEVKNARAKLSQNHLVIEKYLNKFNVKDFDVESKKKIVDFFKRKVDYGEFPIEKKIRWNNQLREREELKDWKLNIFFDYPKPLRIHVSYPDGTSKVIDIIESIKKDVSNIGHPLIVKALERYQRVAQRGSRSKKKKSLDKYEVPFPSAQAQGCLEEISKSLKPRPNSKSPTQYLTALSRIKQVGALSLDHFHQIELHLKSPAVKKSRTISNKLMHFRIHLRKEFPELDSTEVLSWLEERLRNNELPRRCDESTLRNDFLAWKWKMKHDSAKIYLCNLRKTAEISQRVSFSDEEISETTEQAVFDLLGLCELPAHDQISNLAFDERAFADLDSREIALQ